MWEEIKNIPGCRSGFAPGGDGEVLFLPVPGIDNLEPSFWMIGRYKDQTRRKGDGVNYDRVSKKGVRTPLLKASCYPSPSKLSANIKSKNSNMYTAPEYPARLLVSSPSTPVALLSS